MISETDEGLSRSITICPATGELSESHDPRKQPSTFACDSAGSTVIYWRSPGDYPPSDGWALTVHLAGGSIASAEAEVISGQFRFTLSAAVTGVLLPGTYKWVERAVKGSEIYDSASGIVTVSPNLASAGEGDLQTFEERMLAVVEARLENRLPADLQSYTIGTRGIMKIPISELLQIRNALRAQVEQQRNPGQFGRKVQITFPRPG